MNMILMLYEYKLYREYNEHNDCRQYKIIHVYINTFSVKRVFYVNFVSLSNNKKYKTKI